MLRNKSSSDDVGHKPPGTRIRVLAANFTRRLWRTVLCGIAALAVSLLLLLRRAQQHVATQATAPEPLLDEAQRAAALARSGSPIRSVAAAAAAVAPAAVAPAAVTPAAVAPAREGPWRPNFLFIMVDDLRPALGCYGDQAARTPHMDSLARQGTIFTGAYASVATCSPSRTSILTGLRPDTHGVYDLVTHFRETVPSATTLPQLLRRKGYTTVSYGKIFHEGLDDAQSWTPQSEFDDGQPSRGTNRTYGDNWWYMDYDDRETQRAWKGHKFGRVTEQSERPASQHMDHAIATRAVDALARLGGADAKKPFFIAVGFVRPHLPWTAPEAAWQRIPKKTARRDERRAEGVQSRRAAGERERDVAPRAGEVGRTARVLGRPPGGEGAREEKALRLAHGYYASVSWADEQVGRVLTALAASPAAPTTVTLLLSDHGWKLGDWGAWSKHTTFEADVRVPLIVRAPPAASLPASAPPALRRRRRRRAASRAAPSSN